MSGAKLNDPFTSYMAAAIIEASGCADSQRSITAAAVKQHPGLTSKELANVTGLCRFMLARRLSEIRIVKKGEARHCRIGGMLSVTWWPSDGV